MAIPPRQPCAIPSFNAVKVRQRRLGCGSDTFVIVLGPGPTDTAAGARGLFLGLMRRILGYRADRGRKEIGNPGRGHILLPLVLAHLVALGTALDPLAARCTLGAFTTLAIRGPNGTLRAIGVGPDGTLRTIGTLALGGTDWTLGAIGIGALRTLISLGVGALRAFRTLGPVTVVALRTFGALWSALHLILASRAILPILPVRPVRTLRAILPDWALLTLLDLHLVAVAVEIIVVVAIIVQRLALVVEPRTVFAEHAEVMIRILQIIFGLDPVASLLGVSRHVLVFLEQLRGIATAALVAAIAASPAAAADTPRLLTSTTAPAAVLAIVHQVQFFLIALAPKRNFPSSA